MPKLAKRVGEAAFWNNNQGVAIQKNVYKKLREMSLWTRSNRTKNRGPLAYMMLEVYQSF